jgi:hypothetical protein
LEQQKPAEEKIRRNRWRCHGLVPPTGRLTAAVAAKGEDWVRT